VDLANLFVIVIQIYWSQWWHIQPTEVCLDVQRVSTTLKTQSKHYHDDKYSLKIHRRQHYLPALKPALKTQSNETKDKVL
jgi:hypothetical protein